MSIAYLNGSFVPEASAMISIHDRAALFADGVYEVMRVHNKKPFSYARHFARLKESLAGLSLNAPKGFLESLPDVIAQLLEKNNLVHAKIYLQISRGAAERNHVFTDDIVPTVLVTAHEAMPYATGATLKTTTAIFTEDIRWSRNCWKTLMLLPATLARTEAEKKGCGEALFVRSEPGPRRVTEGSATNAYAVIGGVLRTHPVSNWILPGITRSVLLEEAKAAGIPVEERAFTPEELVEQATECFVTGTITGILVLTEVEGKKIGGGKPGPVARILWDKLAERVAKECA